MDRAGAWAGTVASVNRLVSDLVHPTIETARVIGAMAKGEVAALKDNINELIRNLKDTTLKNSEQDWLETNLAMF